MREGESSWRRQKFHPLGLNELPSRCTPSLAWVGRPAPEQFRILRAIEKRMKKTQFWVNGHRYQYQIAAKTQNQEPLNCLNDGCHHGFLTVKGSAVVSLTRRANLRRVFTT